MTVRGALGVRVSFVGVVPVGSALDDGRTVVVVVNIDSVAFESGSVGAVQGPVDTGTPASRGNFVDVQPMRGQNGAGFPRGEAERLTESSSAYSG